jgi:hypothetical protein
MFALSFGKILVLGIVLFAVWTLWRRVDRPGPSRVKDEAPGTGPRAAQGDAVDLIPCPVCGVFVSRNNRRRCDRGDCPVA